MCPAAERQVLEAVFQIALSAPPRTLEVSGDIDGLLGFSADDFLNGRFALHDRIHADDADIAASLFAIAPDAHEGSFNLRLRQASGRIRCVKALYAKSSLDGQPVLALRLQDAKSLPRTLSDAALTANFRAMMENTNDFIYFKDRNHVLTGASQTLVSITDPAEHWTDLLGQTDYDVFPEAYADIYYRLEKQVFNGVPVAHEVQGFLTKTGQQGWVDNRKYPIRDEQGEIIGLFGIARDITAQRRLEAALLAIANFVSQDHGERCFDALTEFASHQFEVEYVHLALLEPDRKSVRVVAGTLDGQRIEPGYVYALPGTPCENVLQRAHKCYSEHVQKLFPRDHDLIKLKAEGYVGEPILDSAGAVLGLIVLVSRRPLDDSQDIVAGLRILAARAGAYLMQQRDEQILRRERESLQLILDFAPIGIWLQNGKGKLSVVNKAFCAAMGIPEERFLAVDHYAEVIPEAFREQCIASDAKALSSAGICDNHQRLPFVDGKIHDLRVIKAVKRNADGEPEFLVGLSLDITDELRRDQALKDSEQRFRSLFENTPSIAVQGYDATRRVIFWNQASEVLYGYTHEEALGRQLEDLIIPDAMRQGVIEAVSTWLAGGPEIPAAELVLRHKNGSPVPVYSSHVMQTGPDGPEMYCIDISLAERKDAETKLRLSEERLRLALSAARQAWFDANVQTGEVQVGQEYPRLLGYEPEEFHTTVPNWMEHIHPEDLPRLKAAFQSVVETGGPATMEYRRQTKSGEWKWLQSTGEIVERDADGKALRMTGIHRDITDRKEAESLATRFGRIIDHTLNEIYIFDAETMRFIGANRGACLNLGYNIKELRQLTPLDIKPEFAAERFAEMVQPLRDGIRETLKFEARHQRKNGSLYDAEVHLQFMPDETPPVFVAIVQDISKRKRGEAELEQYRNNLEEQVMARTVELVEAKVNAEAANRAKSAFLANMSHELRTPMNAIMGMTGLALRHAEDPKLRDQLGKIDQASKHLLGVINDVLDISKIEADRMVLEQTDFQLGSVLENLASLAGHRASDKGLKFVIDLPPGLARLNLIGDPLRLGQVLLNLAGNAIKFTEHGSVTVRVRRNDSITDAALLRFDVIDTGIGITPEAQSRLFTAFEQADNSMTRSYGGTGLGLAISKRLVHLMGGEIGVESAPDRGSTFWFTARLPLGAHAVPAAPSFETDEVEQQIRLRFPGARILLAEDEPINREVSLCLLDAVGLKVDVALDGNEALDLARRNRYALILMDMQMPNLNGVDATRAIRTDSLNRATPILAMTANAFDEDRQICLAAGMNDHLPKPVDPQVLFETLLNWLDKSQA